MTKPTTLGEHTISFERRRYGGRDNPAFFTWVYLQVGPDKWECLGDPWPCVNPKRSEILTEIQQYKAREAEAA